MKTKVSSIVREVNELVDDINNMSEQSKKSSIEKLEQNLKKLILPNGDVVDGLVFKTKQPNQFGDIKGNRIINEDSVYTKGLAESLMKYGNVAPIIVNEDDEIIDGQRRVIAMKKYDVHKPLRYTRVFGANINTVGDINRLQFRWTYKDWLHKYIEMGVNDYIQYAQIEEKYGKFIRSRALRSLLMNNKIEAFKSEIWERGDFTINHSKLPLVIQFLDFLNDVQKIGGVDNIFAKNRNFQKALWNVYSNSNNLNEHVLLKKIKQTFNRLNVRTETENYLKILKKISDVNKRPVGRPRIKKDIPIENKRPVGRPRIKKQDILIENKRPVGRPRKKEFVS